MDFVGLIKDIGAPAAAVIIQAILTWQRVREQGKKLDRHDEIIFGEYGLLSRVKILEHDAGRAAP